MIPAFLINRMYGSSLFADGVLRSIDRELVEYLETEKVDIFAQPLPDELNLRQLDVNSPTDYHFSFEIGLKPDFKLADLGKTKTTRYKVKVTDEMINSEIARLQNRYGNMKDEDTVTTEENVLNVTFSEVDENGNNLPDGITKDNSLLVKYFAQNIRKERMTKAKKQVQQHAYHELLDHTEIKFPEDFLKKWMKTQGEKSKSDEDVEKELPVFINQLKWTLISDKIVSESGIQVTQDEIRNFARQQLFGYMGMGQLDEEQAWVKDYVEKMMKDRKYLEDAYNRIQGQKIFDWAEIQLNPEEKQITAEEFTKLVEAHQHHHH